MRVLPGCCRTRDGFTAIVISSLAEFDNRIRQRENTTTKITVGNSEYNDRKMENRMGVR